MPQLIDAEEVRRRREEELRRTEEDRKRELVKCCSDWRVRAILSVRIFFRKSEKKRKERKRLARKWNE
jgi:hypothetical protein